jgi:hypothetical protein
MPNLLKDISLYMSFGYFFVMHFPLAVQPGVWDANAKTKDFDILQRLGDNTCNSGYHKAGFAV